MSGLAAVLETLTADYTFDAEGRIVATREQAIPPRFVLGRAAEGCVWRFRADLERRALVGLARLAGREPGARFDGELPAAPERLASMERLLGESTSQEVGAPPPRSRRRTVTRSGVTVGELWSID